MKGDSYVEMVRSQSLYAVKVQVGGLAEVEAATKSVANWGTDDACRLAAMPTSRELCMPIRGVLAAMSRIDGGQCIGNAVCWEMADQGRPRRTS
jgi:hypothetical protein